MQDKAHLEVRIVWAACNRHRASPRT